MFDKIAWNGRPDTVQPGHKLDLIRCKIGSTPPVICLSDRHIGCEVHWWGGRSFPHLANGCPACDDKRPSVWKGWVAVYLPRSRTVAILEFTHRCTDALDAYYLAHGTLRGGVITLQRNGNKVNGRLNLSIVTGELACNELPPAPDLKEHLEIMWAAKRFDNDIRVEPHRPVVEAPQTHEEQRRRNPSRFTTEGTGVSAIYQTTPQQREMLKRNGERNALTTKTNNEVTQ